jgi:hypothetical protein
MSMNRVCVGIIAGLLLTAPAVCFAQVNWNNWASAKDANGSDTPVWARWTCTGLTDTNGAHEWAVQFKNDHGTNTYVVQFQLVSGNQGSPPDWPTHALSLTVQPGDVFTAPSAAVFYIQADCTESPRLFTIVTRVQNPQ